MHVVRMWHVLRLLGFVVASLCLNDVEYEGNYADDYDNEISQDREGESNTPCQTADFSRWDKLFIALEDSHMRQNMLLDSLEKCCGGMVSLRTHVEKLSRGTCQQYVPSVVSACRTQAEQASLKLQRGLMELREEEEERERRLNITLQMLLRSSHEDRVRLGRLEEGDGHRVETSGPEDNGMRHQPTPRPGGLGAAFTSGMKSLQSGLKQQEVMTSPLDVATIEKALVAIATELQSVHLQLSRVIEQAGTLRKNRGDT